MNKILLIFITFLIISNIAKSDIWGDTLAIKTMQNDTNKVNLLLSISEKLYDFDTDLGIKYAQDGLELSSKLNFKSGIARSYKSFGINYWRMGIYDKAIENLFSSIKYYKEINDGISICKCYNNIGLIYFARVDTFQAFKYFNLGLDIAKKLNNLVEQSRIKHNMGLIQYEYGDKNKAFELFKKSYKLAISVNEQRLMAFNEVFIGRSFTSFKKLDSAEFYIKKGIARFESLDAPNNVAMAFNQYSELLIAKKDYLSAIEYANKAAELGKTIGNRYLIMESSKNIKNAYIEMKDFENALKYNQKYNELSDSMINESNIKKIAELESKMKYEQEIAGIKQQKEKEILINQVIISILLFISIVIFIFLRWKSSINNKLKQQNDEITHLNKDLKELNSTKDKFFSIIAHDLKNPLGTFKNVTEMMYALPDDFSNEERKDFLKMMKDSADNVYVLLENLLEWSRSQNGSIIFNPENINFYYIVELTINFLNASAQSKNIDLINHIPYNYTITADVNMITTVIRNLVSNAIKFTNENGKVEIGIDQKSEINSIYIYIKDTGIGMSNEIKSKLFRIDENVTSLGTSGEKGTGLGLILCKEFIEAHGGKIWVESKEGVGSKFFISLPITDTNIKE